MGVSFLWHILQPVKEHVPLSSLSGKTLAVDLSIWVCEAQTVKRMIGVVTKPYLRNLFFRISTLTLMGVKLVFVMEGEAPKLKAETMKMRNEMRFGSTETSEPSRPGRSYFMSILKECLCLLECLGIPWVQAAGEAEAMCAYLNACGYVDGCITNDGDVFLYGACTVYRNFTMNVKDPHVDCYTMASIKERLGLDRDALVGIAILLGCDYLPKGIPGVGKDHVLKLIRMLNGQSILQRFDHWAEQFENGRNSAKALKKVAHCPTCCHPGSAKEHEKRGCMLCGSNLYCTPNDYSYLCPCPWHLAQREKKANAFENNIKRKARACVGFPFREVIHEFLVSKDKLTKRITWLRPNILSFQNFAYNRMEWQRHYSCEKVFVLMTYYDMTERAAGRVDPRQLQATRIVKMRVRNGIPCFEIQWEKPDHFVFTNEQASDTFVVSIEEESLFQAAYPNIVSMYNKEKLEADEKKSKGKKNKTKDKGVSDQDDIAELISHMNLDPKIQTFPSCDSESRLMPLPKEFSNAETEASSLPTSLELQNDSPASDIPHFKTDSASELFLPDIDLCTSEPLLTVTTARQFHAHVKCLASPTKYVYHGLETPSPSVSSVISELQLSNIDWDTEVFVPDADVGTSHLLKTVESAKQICHSDNLLASPAHVSKLCLEAPSPNVTSVISELQLSSIDWESSSFCSSPQLEAPLRPVSKNVLDKKAAPGCGNSTNQQHNKAVKSNTGNTIPLSVHQAPADMNGGTCVSSDSFVVRQPLEERILLKNGCQLSCPQPKKQRDLNAVCPKLLSLAECKKQASNSWSGNISDLHSLRPGEAPALPPGKPCQRSLSQIQVGDPSKLATAAQIFGNKTKSNMLKPSVRRIEAINARKLLVSTSLKMPAVQVKEVTAVDAVPKICKKTGLNSMPKKSVCRSPPRSSSEDSDIADIGIKKQNFSVKGHCENHGPAQLPSTDNCAERLALRIAGMKIGDGKTERPGLQGSRNRFVFDNASVLSVRSASVTTAENTFQRAPLKELQLSPGPQSADNSLISDSPLPLSERIKMRLLQNT
ncbi:flap endonuclease GEN homolog 1 [Lissotriton helveticus]